MVVLMESCTNTNFYKLVSQIACVCVSFFLVINIHIPLYLDSRGKPFFRTSKFFSLVPVSIISIRISFSNCQFFYFRSLLTIRSLSLTLISPMWHGITLTLFPKFQYLDEKMYLGRWLFPLATFFLRYLLVIIRLGWIELTSNHFHLSHSYMSNWYPTTRLYEFIQTRSALSLYKVYIQIVQSWTIRVTTYQLMSSLVTIGVGCRHTNSFNLLVSTWLYEFIQIM